MNARSLLSLLFHGKKALDLVEAAHALGIFARLDRGPCTLGELVRANEAVPLRMYKLMDGLESLGLVIRTETHDDILEAVYHAEEPLVPAVEAVLGERSIERDRDTYPWQQMTGHQADIVRGKITPTGFDWPPKTPEQIASFEESMARGTPPIVEALGARADELFAGEKVRWLDVGGGDGIVAEAMCQGRPGLRADVYNLPAVEPLVRARSEKAKLDGRLGFRGGDFLNEALPTGYDVMSFVRVLHDWPADVSRMLIEKAYAALPSGGKIVVCEEFRTADRLAVQFFWTYFLVGFDPCVSRLRERSWYEEALARAGFRDVAAHDGAFEVVVAKKP